MSRYLNFEARIPLKQSPRLRQAVSRLRRDLEAKREDDIGWNFEVKGGRLEISGIDVQGMDARELEQVLAPFARDHATCGFAVTGYEATGDGPDEKLELFLGPGDSAYQAELDYRLDEFGEQLRKLGFSRGKIAALGEMIRRLAPGTPEERESAALRAAAERLHGPDADRYATGADRTYIIVDGPAQFEAGTGEEAAARYALSEQDVYAPCEEGATSERTFVVYGEQSGQREEIIYLKGLIGRRIGAGHRLSDGREPEEIVRDAEESREEPGESGPRP